MLLQKSKRDFHQAPRGSDSSMRRPYEEPLEHGGPGVDFANGNAAGRFAVDSSQEGRAPSAIRYVEPFIA